jgi:acyl-CoA thioester hydrolase
MSQSGSIELRRSIYRVRVGYVDTDQAQVVHHSTYFRWLEQARVELLREGGLEYRSWEAATRLGLPLVDATIRYVAPCRFDDVVIVETHIGALARTALRFDSKITIEGRAGSVVTEAQIRLACVHLETGPRRVPEEVLRACGGDDYASKLVRHAQTKLTLHG